MQEKLEFKGYFWQPENQEYHIAGVLKFDQYEGIDLELFGEFKKRLNSNSKENNIVLGITSNGKKITLLNCHEYSRGLSLPGFQHSSISSIYLFIGAHFESIEDFTFDSLTIVYKDLNLWLDISGFEKPSYDEKHNEVTITYKRPDNLWFNLNQDWKIEIMFSFYGPIDYFTPLEKIEIKQIPEIILKSSVKRKFQDFQNYLYAINSFLSVCYYTFPIVSSLEFHGTQKHEKENGIKANLYFLDKVNYKNYRQHDSHHDFLITYTDIKDSLQKKLNNWIALKEKIAATIDILTECFMNRGNPIELHFLSLSQAMENMHRRITTEDIYFKHRIEAMIKNVPVKIKKALLFNEPDFVERIRINRNYFTHFDEKHEKKAAPLSELYMLSEKMKIILLVNVLKEIDLSNTEVEEIILNKGKFLFNHLIKTNT
ncbi:MAG: HEPN domain-containing protein [Ginsengibacter sp.]